MCLRVAPPPPPPRQDLMKIDPDRARDVRVTLVEAMQVSSTPKEGEHAHPALIAGGMTAARGMH